MATLVMHLTGPLQAWGTESRFMRRTTDDVPSKSGVLGMLAAARGLRRTDPLTELLQLRFGVRADKPGKILREYQTARGLDTTAQGSRQSERHFLADAAFLAAVEGPDDLIDGLAEALRRPYYTPYLGRRSCPPAKPVLEEVVDEPLRAVLGDTGSWEALTTREYRRTQPSRVKLQIVRDAEPGETPSPRDGRTIDSVRDQPQSFDPRHRQYTWRQVVREHVTVPNRDSRKAPEHDPFAALGG